MRLSKNLYQVCGRMYGSHQNVYVIDAESSLIMIDSGLNKKDLQIIERNLDYWKLNKPISYLFLTHEHMEHCNNAAYFQSKGAKVCSNRIVAERVKKGGKLVCDYCFPEIEFNSVLVDQVIDSCFEAEGILFEIKEAKGHSDGSSLIFTKVDNQRAVFTGDVFLLTELCHKVSMGSSAALDYQYEKLIETAKKFKDETADLFLPGHGEVCLEGASILFCGAYLIARQTMTSTPAYQNAEVVYADYQ